MNKIFGVFVGVFVGEFFDHTEDERLVCEEREKANVPSCCTSCRYIFLLLLVREDTRDNDVVKHEKDTASLAFCARDSKSCRLTEKIPSI